MINREIGRLLERQVSGRVYKIRLDVHTWETPWCYAHTGQWTVLRLRAGTANANVVHSA